MSYSILGYVGAVAFIFGLLLEIPSGVLADRFGRKRTVILSLFFLLLSGTLISFATNAYHLVIGVFLLQAGFAFLSGSLEALTYDNLKEIGKEEEFEKVISRSVSVSILAVSVSILIGGYVFKFNDRLPYLLWTFSSVAAFIAGMFLKDTKSYIITEDTDGWFTQLVAGASALLTKSNIFVALSVFASFGVFYFFDWGFYKSAILIHNNVSAFNQSVSFSLGNFIAALFTALMLPILISRFNKQAVLISFMLAMSCCFFVLGIQTHNFAIIPVLFIILIGNAFYALASIIINNNIESELRATTLSTLTFTAKVLFIILSAFSGLLIENNKIEALSYLLALIVLLPIPVLILFTIRTRGMNRRARKSVS